MKPIILTDDESGKIYTLEFDVEAVKYAEKHGFIISDIDKKPMTGVLDLVFYAFRKHHPSVSRETTDKIVEELGGVADLPDGFVERLAELYTAPFKSAEGVRKNSIKVEF